MLHTLEELLSTQTEVSELVIFTGKTGSGKTTIMNALKRLDGIPMPQARYVATGERPRLRIREGMRYTTRGQRKTESTTVSVDPAEFQRLVDIGEIKLGYISSTVKEKYGLARSATPQANEVVIAQTSEFATAIDARYLARAIVVDVTAPDNIIRERILQRGGSPTEMSQRISLIKAHMSAMPAHDLQGQQVLYTQRDGLLGIGYERGAAHLIVENTGDPDTIARTLLTEILRYDRESQGSHMTFPPQRLITGQGEVIELKPEMTIDANGVGVELPEINAEQVLMIGAIHPWNGSLRQPRYFLRLSQGDDLKLESDRPFIFRGETLQPLELWSGGDFSSALRRSLYFAGMSPSSPRNTTERSYIPSNARFLDGHHSTRYATIVTHLVRAGFKKIVS